MCGGAKVTGVRRCVRSSFGMVSEILVCVVILGEARHNCYSQYNADADVI